MGAETTGRLLVLGANGPTGRETVQQAVDRGYEVHALTRHPEDFPITHDRVRVVAGDATDPAVVDAAVAGTDAVVCAIGARFTRRPVEVYSTSAHLLITSMVRHGRRRLVVVTSSGVAPSHSRRGVVQRASYRLTRSTFARTVYDDMVRMETYVRGSGLDWTVVRPPGLTTGPRTRLHRRRGRGQGQLLHPRGPGGDAARPARGRPLPPAGRRRRHTRPDGERPGDVPHRGAEAMTRPQRSTAVEVWQDGRQQVPGDGHAELWHFDGRLDDGTSIAVAFCLVGVDPDDAERWTTVVNVMLTGPDGSNEVHASTGTVPAAAASTARCDLPFGPHRAAGDLTSYGVHVEADDGGLVLDLRYTAVCDPHRPERITLDDGDGGGAFFDHLVVPRCSIAGTITRAGVVREVSGEGYHDHQWFDADPLTTWHRWLLGHVGTDTHTAVVFDLVAAERFGFDRQPLVTVFDTDGHLVLHTADAQCSVEAFTDPSSRKQYPRQASYTARDGATAVRVDVEWETTLVSDDVYARADDAGGGALRSGSRQEFDALGIAPSYARYLARGRIEVTDERGPTRSTGEMVCELNHPGRETPAAPLSTS
ncbi:NAD(P)H-binding protein [Klenkia sp. LSe6-5]|uniref:NAD(P)H-binding protein n=1 Tax=Klenkia sesuvii TaxID=3103137 RepID=A0ABU8DRQ2_9ACTN